MYRAMLEQYNIFFEATSRSFTNRSKQILHIVPQEDNLLYIIKVYRELKYNDVLFVNLNKDSDIHNEIVDMSDVSRHTHLVIISSKKSKESIQEICSKIKSWLGGQSDKKLVLIAEKNDEIAKHFRNRNGSYEMVRENIFFTDFNKVTRHILLEQHIVFQGKQMKLRKVFPTSTEEDINCLLNFETLTKLAKGEPVEIDAEIEPLNDYYIPRKFHRNNVSVSQKEMIQLKETSETRVSLISGFAGMGKSFLLRNMAVSIKDNSPHVWVVLVDLSNYSRNLRNVKEYGPNWHVTLTRLLDADTGTKFKSAFERHLFSAAEKVLLIDSVDEIGHTYEHIVFNMLKDCKKTSSFTKIFVTTRPHLRERLERLMNVKSWTLSPLTNEEQTGFLENYWSTKLKLQFGNSLEKEKCGKLLNITGGTPLYTTMLAEIFSDAPDECNTLKELSGKKNNTSGLPIVDLYETFIKNKRLQVGLEEELEKQAIKNTFGKHLFSNYKQNQKNAAAVDSSNVNFLHKTFAEYFAAKSVIKELRKQSTKLKRFLVEELLYRYEYNGVRGFVESFLLRDGLLPSSSNVDQNINFSDNRERNFLHVLAREGCVEILRYMFRCFNSFNFTDDELSQCWPFAPKVKQSNFNFVDVPNEFGRTPLQEAAKWAHLDVIEFLLEQNANIDVTDEFCRTPLHTAARDGCLDVVKCLVKNGADVNAKDKDGNTPLLDAARECHSDIVIYLVENGREKEANLSEKEKRGRVDINAQDELDATVLHYYAYSNNLLMVAFLLQEKTVDVNKKMMGSCTALHAAAYLENLDMVTLLIERDADVNCAATTFPLICGYLTRNRTHLDKWKAAMKLRIRGFTALHLAVHSGNLDIVEFLIEKKGDVNMSVQDGDCAKTVIDMARESDNWEELKYLMKSSVNAGVVELDTAHYITAPGSRRVDMLNYLIDKSAGISQIFSDKVNCSKPSVAANEDAEKIKYTNREFYYSYNPYKIGRELLSGKSSRDTSIKDVSDYKSPEAPHLLLEKNYAKWPNSR